MWLITLILSIIYIIWLTNLINFGIRTATRIAVASEATALSVASIYHALSPEAKERARDFQRQIEESNAANAKVIAKARSERDYKIGIAVVALVLMVIMWATWSAHAEPLQSRSFYDSRGSFAGSSTQHGSSTSFYDRSGRFSGSAIHNSDGTTSFYDKSGKFTGSSNNTTQPR